MLVVECCYVNSIGLSEGETNKWMLFETSSTLVYGSTNISNLLLNDKLLNIDARAKSSALPETQKKCAKWIETEAWLPNLRYRFPFVQLCQDSVSAPIVRYCKGCIFNEWKYFCFRRGGFSSHWILVVLFLIYRETVFLACCHMCYWNLSSPKAWRVCVLST